MSDRRVLAIIGKGFGDEGKGLATDYFCRQASDTLVIKHNGGAQAGHTVEPEGKRFVFHQLSAGSFCGADTFWADSYYPDLYKLGEEMEDVVEEEAGAGGGARHARDGAVGDVEPVAGVPEQRAGQPQPEASGGAAGAEEQPRQRGEGKGGDPAEAAGDGDRVGGEAERDA